MPIKYFTQQDIQTLLLAESPAPDKITHDFQGPAELDGNRAVFTDEGTYVHHPIFSERPIKILLTNMMLREEVLEEALIIFLACLIRHTSVYILENGIPHRIHHVNDVLKLTPAKKEAAENILNKSHIAASEYLILDHDEFSKLTERAGITEYGNERLNLQYMDLDQESTWENITTYIDTKAIQELLILAPTDEQSVKLRKLFPNLKTVEIHDVTTDWIQTVAPHWQFLHWRIQMRPFADDTITFPALALKSLNVHVQDKNSTLSIDKLYCPIVIAHNLSIFKLSDNITELDIYDFVDIEKTVDKKNILALQKLRVTKKTQVSKFLFYDTTYPNLKKLQICTDIENIDSLLKIAPNLECLEIITPIIKSKKNKKTPPAIIPKHASLKSLTLTLNSYDGTIQCDLKEVPKLETFNGKNVKFLLQNPPPHLNELTIESDSIENLNDIIKFSKLKILSLKYYTNNNIQNEILNLPDNLKTCTIHSLDSSRLSINLQNCNDLIKLCLVGNIKITGRLPVTIKELVIRRNDEKNEIDISNLEKLSFTEAKNLTATATSITPTLLELDLDYLEQLDQLQIQSLPKLKTLQINGQKKDIHDLHVKFPQLMNIEIILNYSKHSDTYPNINISTSQFLLSAKLYNINHCFCMLPQSITSLCLEGNAKFSADHPNLQITKLSISAVYEDDTLRFIDWNSVLALEVRQTSRIFAIDYPSLQSLTVIHAPFFNNLELNTPILQVFSISGSRSYEKYVSLKNANKLSKIFINLSDFHLAVEKNSQIKIYSTIQPETTEKETAVTTRSGNTQPQKVKYSPGDAYSNLDGKTFNPIRLFPSLDLFDFEKNKLTIFSEPQISPNYYYLFVLNEISIERRVNTLWLQNKLTYQFSQTDLKERPLVFVTDSYSPDKDHDIVILEGSSEPGKLMPLPTSCGAKAISFIQSACEITEKSRNDMKLFYHPLSMKFFLTFHKKTNFKLVYRATLDKVQLKEKNQLCLEDRTKLLPTSLLNALDQKLKDFEPLKFLYDQHMTPYEKYKRIVNYCSNFQPSPFLRSAHALNPVNLIFKLIKNPKQGGVCRHRTEVAMVLLAMAGIRSFAAASAKHMWLVTPFRDENNDAHTQHCDLGGGTPRYLFGKEKELAPDPLPLLIDKKEKVLIENDPLHEPHESSTIKNSAKALISYYESTFQNLLPKTLHDLSELFSPHFLKPPLLELPLNIDAFSIYQHIKLKQSDCLYIANPQELQAFFKPYQLQANGKRQKIDGPLWTALKKATLVIINWNAFSTLECVKYQSLLDKQPQLFSESFQRVKIINLSTRQSAGDRAFKSRCQSCWMSEDYWAAHPELTATIPAPDASQKPFMEIELYNGHRWQQLLLNDIEFYEHQARLLPTQLTDLLLLNISEETESENTEKKHIFIYNAPPEASDVLNRLQRDHEIFYNGQFWTLPKQYQVELATRPYSKKLPPQVSLTTDRASIADLTPIHLTLENWHLLYKRLKANPNEGAEKLPNLLEAISDTQYFHINGAIPESEWQYALDILRTRLPNKKVCFYLAPQASLENTLTNSEPPRAVNVQQQNLYYSNDIDFCAQNLQLDNPHASMMDIGPQIAVHDWVIEERMRRSDDGSFYFTHQQKILFNYLKAGQTVIIKGPVPPAFYAQILSLLHQPPYYYANGERMTLTGRLLLVQPIAQKEKLKSFTEYQAEEKMYTFSDYRQALPLEDSALLDHLELFYHYAAQWPHHQEGMPSAPPLSFQLLHGLLSTLKNPVVTTTSTVHKHNPIKGRFHLQYDRDSTAYAYFNVLSKWFLYQRPGQQPIRTTAAHFKKLENLLMPFKSARGTNVGKASYKIPWELLNCFHGEELIQILGKNLNALPIEIAQGIPVLNETAVNALIQCLIEAHKTLKAKKEETEEDIAVFRSSDTLTKQDKQFLDFLNHPENKVAFLRGPAGTGKSHTLRQSQRVSASYQTYESEIAILDWLNPEIDQQVEYKVLVLNEFNLRQEGYWNFLKGITQKGGKNSIVYNGIVYPLSEKHKIVVTGNPESYPNRNFHTFIQANAEIIDFKKMSSETLLQVIVAPALPHVSEAHQRLLLEAYTRVAKHHPQDTLSVRRLISLIQRFQWLLSEAGNATLTSLYQAAYAEFAGLMYSRQEREDFSHALQTLLNIHIPPRTDMIVITPQYVLPPSQAYLYDSLKQNLLMRAQGEDFNPGMLIEGPAGRGKTEFYLAVLHKEGYLENHSDPAKRYYRTTARAKNARDTILKAMQEGAIVVIDELNLDDTLEDWLNDFMEGKNTVETGHPEFKVSSKFMVLASQNPGKRQQVRTTLSQALLDRFNFNFVEDYSDEELEKIAHYRGVQDAKLFTEQYRKHANGSEGLRNFFAALDVVTKPSQEEKISSQEKQSLESISLQMGN